MKKKRIFLLGCAVAALGAAVLYGPYVVGACIAGVVVLLTLLKAWHLLMAHQGVSRLVRLRPRYDVEMMGEALSAQEPSGRPWSFIVLGDTRNNRPVARQLYRRAANEDAVMAFHTGDIVRKGTAKELLYNHVHLLEVEAPALPVFCVPGNHERGPRHDYMPFKRLYGADRFTFEYDNCRFVGMNNTTRRGLSEEDFAFLEEALAATGIHKFVFIHIPPAFFEATFVNDTRRRGFKKGADRFHQLMCEHAVDEVFMAHIHGYAAAVIDGVRYTLTAGGGAPLSKRLVPAGRHYHLLKLTVSAEGVERHLLTYQQKAWSQQSVAAVPEYTREAIE